MAIPEGQLSLVPEAFSAGARAHGRRTLEASVRMSFESFTRHCRGTVTSITFTFSFFLLLSLTNFPYQALTMMSPEDRLRQGRGERRPAPPHAAGPREWCAPWRPLHPPCPKIPREATPSHPSWILLPRLSFGQIPASAEPAKTKAGRGQGRTGLPSVRATACAWGISALPLSLTLDTCHLTSGKNNSFKGKKKRTKPTTFYKTLLCLLRATASHL